MDSCKTSPRALSGFLATFSSTPVPSQHKIISPWATHLRPRCVVKKMRGVRDAGAVRSAESRDTNNMHRQHASREGEEKKSLKDIILEVGLVSCFFFLDGELKGIARRSMGTVTAAGWVAENFTPMAHDLCSACSNGAARASTKGTETENWGCGVTGGSARRLRDCEEAICSRYVPSFFFCVFPSR
jgi:hypothetical protein